MNSECSHHEYPLTSTWNAIYKHLKYNENTSVNNISDLLAQHIRWTNNSWGQWQFNLLWKNKFSKQFLNKLSQVANPTIVVKNIIALLLGNFHSSTKFHLIPSYLCALFHLKSGERYIIFLIHFFDCSRSKENFCDNCIDQVWYFYDWTDNVDKAILSLPSIIEAKITNNKKYACFEYDSVSKSRNDDNYLFAQIKHLSTEVSIYYPYTKIPENSILAQSNAEITSSFDYKGCNNSADFIPNEINQTVIDEMETMGYHKDIWDRIYDDKWGIKLSKQEQFLVKTKTPFWLAGRPGTGKTTVILIQLFCTYFDFLIKKTYKSNNEINFKYMKNCISTQTIKEQFKVVFTTFNSNLCLKTQELFNQIVRKQGFDITFREWTPQRLSSISSFRDVDTYPLFVNFRKWIFMIDGTITCQFFARKNLREYNRYSANDDLEYAEETNFLCNQYSSDELNYDENNNGYRFSLKPSMETTTKKEANESTFISFYNSEIKKKHNELNLKLGNYDPLEIYSQIHSVIKGSLFSYLSTTNLISREEYKSKGRKLTDLPDWDWVYDVCLKYETWKQQKEMFDIQDLTNHLIRQVKLEITDESRKFIDYLFIDEMQDWTINQIYLLILVTKYPKVYAGDTSQTISPVNRFRFTDLKNIFYYFEQNIKNFQPVQSALLNLNYRLNCNILKLSTFLAYLMRKIFPNTLDKYQDDFSVKVTPFTPCWIKDWKSFTSTILDNSANSDKKHRLTFTRNHCFICRNKEEARKWSTVFNDKFFTSDTYRSKGLEYEIVIWYNFFAHSPYIQLWKVLFNSISITDSSSLKQRTQYELLTLLKSESVIELINRLDFYKDNSDDDDNDEKNEKEKLAELKEKAIIDTIISEHNKFIFPEVDLKIDRKTLFGFCTELKEWYVNITRAQTFWLFYDDDNENGFFTFCKDNALVIENMNIWNEMKEFFKVKKIVIEDDDELEHNAYNEYHWGNYEKASYWFKQLNLKQEQLLVDIYDIYNTAKGKNTISFTDGYNMYTCLKSLKEIRDNENKGTGKTEPNNSNADANDIDSSVSNDKVNEIRKSWMMKYRETLSDRIKQLRKKRKKLLSAKGSQENKQVEKINEEITSWTNIKNTCVEYPNIDNDIQKKIHLILENSKHRKDLFAFNDETKWNGFYLERLGKYTEAIEHYDNSNSYSESAKIAFYNLKDYNKAFRYYSLCNNYTMALKSVEYLKDNKLIINYILSVGLNLGINEFKANFQKYFIKYIAGFVKETNICDFNFAKLPKTVTKSLEFSSDCSLNSYCNQIQSVIEMYHKIVEQSTERISMWSIDALIREFNLSTKPIFLQAINCYYKKHVKDIWKVLCKTIPELLICKKDSRREIKYEAIRKLNLFIVNAQMSKEEFIEKVLPFIMWTSSPRVGWSVLSIKSKYIYKVILGNKKIGHPDTMKELNEYEKLFWLGWYYSSRGVNHFYKGLLNDSLYGKDKPMYYFPTNVNLVEFKWLEDEEDNCEDEEEEDNDEYYEEEEEDNIKCYGKQQKIKPNNIIIKAKNERKIPSVKNKDNNNNNDKEWTLNNCDIVNINNFNSSKFKCIVDIIQDLVTFLSEEETTPDTPTPGNDKNYLKYKRYIFYSHQISHFIQNIVFNTKNNVNADFDLSDNNCSYWTYTLLANIYQLIRLWYSIQSLPEIKQLILLSLYPQRNVIPWHTVKIEELSKLINCNFSFYRATNEAEFKKSKIDLNSQYDAKSHWYLITSKQAFDIMLNLIKKFTSMIYTMSYELLSYPHDKYSKDNLGYVSEESENYFFQIQFLHNYIQGINRQEQGFVYIKLFHDFICLKEDYYPYEYDCDEDNEAGDFDFYKYIWSMFYGEESGWETFNKLVCLISSYQSKQGYLSNRCNNQVKVNLLLLLLYFQHTNNIQYPRYIIDPLSSLPNEQLNDILYPLKEIYFQGYSQNLKIACLVQLLWFNRYTMHLMERFYRIFDLSRPCITSYGNSLNKTFKIIPQITNEKDLELHLLKYFDVINMYIKSNITNDLGDSYSKELFTEVNKKLFPKNKVRNINEIDNSSFKKNVGHVSAEVSWNTMFQEMNIYCIYVTWSNVLDIVKDKTLAVSDNVMNGIISFKALYEKSSWYYKYLLGNDTQNWDRKKFFWVVNETEYVTVSLEEIDIKEMAAQDIKKEEVEFKNTWIDTKWNWFNDICDEDMISFVRGEFKNTEEYYDSLMKVWKKIYK